jgi:hypothetical protein
MSETLFQEENSDFLNYFTMATSINVNIKMHRLTYAFALKKAMLIFDRSCSFINECSYIKRPDAAIMPIR